MFLLITINMFDRTYIVYSTLTEYNVIQNLNPLSGYFDL